MKILKALARWGRAVGRRLEPPGSRTPLEESLEQKPGPGSGQQPPSAAGAIGHEANGWMGGP